MSLGLKLMLVLLDSPSVYDESNFVIRQFHSSGEQKSPKENFHLDCQRFVGITYVCKCVCINIHHLYLQNLMQVLFITKHNTKCCGRLLK